MAATGNQPSSYCRGDFATTHWTIVLAAGGKPSGDARLALASLCETYWYPLYAYVRRRGYNAHDALDLTQEFFAHLLQSEAVGVADPKRGKFRSFLLASLNHFLTNQWRSDQAQKRGGGRAVLSLDLAAGEDRYVAEPAHDLTPERIYERRFALTVLERALAQLRDDYEAAGKAALFEQLKPSLGGASNSASYAQIAEELGMTEGAVKVAMHRLRKRCREFLREEIARVVADPSEVDEELKSLFVAIQL